MTEDLLVGLSPPAVAEAVVPPTPPAATGFDFLVDLDQPATAAIACSAQERDKQWIEVFFIDFLHSEHFLSHFKLVKATLITVVLLKSDLVIP